MAHARRPVTPASRPPWAGRPCTAGTRPRSRPAGNGRRPGSGPGSDGRGGRSASRRSSWWSIRRGAPRDGPRPRGQPGPAPSPARIVRLLSGPPRLYWPMLPSVRTTRWQGTMSGTGLCPRAVPTARTALGRPISAAIQPYGRTSPRGISSALVQTATSNSVRPRRSSGIRTRRSPARRRAMASASPAGRAAAREVRRPLRASWRVTAAGPSSARSTSLTPRPFQATQSRPMGDSSGAMRSARPTSTRTSSATWAGAGTARAERAPGVSSASSPAASGVRTDRVMRSAPRAPSRSPRHAAWPGRDGPGP